MNDKEKQKEIQKMQQEIFDSCAWRFSKHPEDYREVANDIGEDLYKLGYRKIPEDSVVLTRENIEKYAKDCIAGQETGLDIINGLIARGESKAERARKKTAKEFAEKVKTKIKELRRKYHEDYINGLGDEEYNGITENDIDEILKEMGVEIGE